MLRNTSDQYHTSNPLYDDTAERPFPRAMIGSISSVVRTVSFSKEATLRVQAKMSWSTQKRAWLVKTFLFGNRFPERGCFQRVWAV